MPSKITEDTSGINRDLHKPARCAGAISMSGEDDADLQRKTEHFMEPPPRVIANCTTFTCVERNKSKLRMTASL
jgi:hypothetical protein